jgi:hypothetical protein
MSQAQKTIELKTDEKGAFIHYEALAAAASTIVAGDLIEVTSAGEVREHSIAAGAGQNAYALANTANAGTIDDVYTVASTVLYGIGHAGQGVNARVAVGTAAIAIGDPVESAGDGTVQPLTGTNIMGYAQEAVDNSAGSATVRIKLTIA